MLLFTGLGSRCQFDSGFNPVVNIEQIPCSWMCFFEVRDKGSSCCCSWVCQWKTQNGGLFFSFLVYAWIEFSLKYTDSRSGLNFIFSLYIRVDFAYVKYSNLYTFLQGSSLPLVVKWADTEKERHARRAQKSQSQPSNTPNTDSGHRFLIVWGIHNMHSIYYIHLCSDGFNCLQWCML